MPLLSVSLVLINGRLEVALMSFSDWFSSRGSLMTPLAAKGLKAGFMASLHTKTKQVTNNLMKTALIIQSFNMDSGKTMTQGK